MCFNDTFCFSVGNFLIWRLYMQQAIRQLPEKTRIVYCMAKEDHMSYKQISEALDISERTVNTHMTTAIRRLTENLQKYFR